MWHFVFCYKMIEVSDKAVGSCLRQNIVIIPPWSWLCQVILKRPISASLNVLHPRRWQAIFIVRALWSSYLKTGRYWGPLSVLHLFLAQKKSWAYKMEMWSLAALSTCVYDAWSILHLGLLDIFLCVGVLLFRTAALQSSNIITLCHRHNHKNLWNKYFWVLGLFSGLRAGPSGRAV